MAALRAVGLLCLLGLASAETGSGAVVSRVVNLIEELKAKIQQDGKVEQKLYDKYACWCETTSARKANDIHENGKQAAEATAIRQKENAAYMANKGEMEQTLGALERAINTLSGAGTKTALLQMSRPADELSLLSTAASVHEAVKALPVGHPLSQQQLSALQAFTSDPAEYYDQKAEKKASYNPASATIQGILKDMYDTFSMNLEKNTEAEAT